MIVSQGGRGDSIRLALHYGGIPFADEHVTYEELGKIKESLPFGQEPVLTINEKTFIPQEGAILRYVGWLTGLIQTMERKLSTKMLCWTLLMVWLKLHTGLIGF